MVAENKVQFICSDNLNAPTLPNSWGVLINVLDAALVNGLALPSVSSVLVEGSIVNITFSSAHKIKLFQTVLLSGFNPDILNKKWRVVGVPSDLTIAIDKDEQVLTVSTIGVARLNALGYEKKFSTTGKAVYRNANELAEHRPFLRVDCTKPDNWGEAYAKVARVGLMTECVSIDDISSGFKLPYSSSEPNKNWESTGQGNAATTFWAKWLYSDVLLSQSSNYLYSIAGNKKWTVVGDEDAFYLIVQNEDREFNKQVYGFGIYDQNKNVPLPYFLGSYSHIDSNVAATTTRTAVQSTLPWRGFMGNSLYINGNQMVGSDVSLVDILSGTGGTTTTYTYFGKHNPGMGSNVFIPQFVMSNGMQGTFKHIVHPLWNPNTNVHFKTEIYDGEMFLLEPTLFKAVLSLSTEVHTSAFYLGKL